MKKNGKTALITGIAGQDGSYLAKFLLKKKYKIIGIEKLNFINKKKYFWRLKELGIKEKVNIKKININNILQIEKVLKNNHIDEFYNLASLSSVEESFKKLLPSINTNGLLPVKILEAIKNTNPKIRFYQASSSEMFGSYLNKKQNEKTPISPLSPYSISKSLAHHFVRYYRQAFSLFAVSGILFNHESPLRGKQFVTKKIVNGLVKISMGSDHIIKLGNIYSLRDWGYAEDYVKVMWKMLQQNKPEDFVICSGKNYSIKDFINECIFILKIQARWIGKGVNEKLIDTFSEKTLIEINKKYFRPVDIYKNKGSSHKAKKKLNWKVKNNFKKLVKIMIDSEIRNIKYGGHGKN